MIINLHKIKIYPITSLLILVTFISSCHNSESKLVELYGFKNLENIKSKTLKVSSEINKATNLYIFDSLLFVGDRDSEYHFKIINLEEDALKGKFGKEGEGPCEVTFPVRLNWLDSNQELISLYDRQRFTIQTYKLDDIFKKQFPNCLTLSNKLDTNFQLVTQIDSSNYVETGLFEGRYAVQNINQTEAKESSIGFPKSEKDQKFDFQTLAMAYQGKFLKHPTQNKIVSTTLFAFSFDIIELTKENEIKIINRIHHWEPEFVGSTGNIISAAMKEGNKFGCLDVAVSNEYIYILFSGKSNISEDSRESNIIMIYDWKGLPIKALSLDKSISKIAVQKDDNFLIGFIDSVDPLLIKFPL